MNKFTVIKNTINFLGVILWLVLTTWAVIETQDILLGFCAIASWVFVVGFGVEQLVEYLNKKETQERGKHNAR